MIMRTAVLLVIGLGAGALAQTRPDFTGIWIPGAVKSSATDTGVAALPPSDLTIQHTPAALAISRTAFDQVITQTYKLDGSESTNKSGAVTSVTKTRWDGPRLVIEGQASQVTSAGYAAWTFKEAYSLNARGRLVAESEYKGSDGTVKTSTREYTKKPSK